MRIADQLGFAPRPLRLDVEELSNLRLPCILHWDLNHFVVLVSCRARPGIVIHDPAMGMRRMKQAEVSRHFTGVALELYPTDRFEPADRAAADPVPEAARPNGRRQAGPVPPVLVCTGDRGLRDGQPPVHGMGRRSCAGSADRDLLVTLVLGFLLLLLMQTAIGAMRSWMLIGLSATLKVQSRANLFSHLINLPASFFEARHLGDVTSRFSSQETILNAITTELDRGRDGWTDGGLTLAIMMVIAPDMASIVVAAAALYALLRWACMRPSGKPRRRPSCGRRGSTVTSSKPFAAFAPSSCSTGRRIAALIG